MIQDTPDFVPPKALASADFKVPESPVSDSPEGKKKKRKRKKASKEPVVKPAAEEEPMETNEQEEEEQKESKKETQSSSQVCISVHFIDLRHFCNSLLICNCIFLKKPTKL